MKIAIVYDRINKFGGAERVLMALNEIWPDAPLYTAIYNKKRARWAEVFKIKTSFLKFLPFFSSLHEYLPLITPNAFESFDFSDYDVVLSVTSSDAKGIITKPTTLHICLCLTPTRYLWSGFNEYLFEPGMGTLNSLTRILMKYFFSGLRRWDKISSYRPDRYIAISQTIKKRLSAYYQIPSTVIYPPVNTEIFKPGKKNSNTTKQDFYLIVSRLVPYKQLDYAISAFNKLGWKLIIIGSGIDEKRLKSLSSPNIHFLGDHLTDERLRWYYQNCTAYIFPGEEDFGISAVEAQACGKPVIGLFRGGIGEIVKPGLTGELYSKPSENELISVLTKSLGKKYSSQLCRLNGLRFSKEKFQQKIKLYTESEWNDWRKKL